MESSVRPSTSVGGEIKEEPLDHDELFESGSAELKREESGYQAFDTEDVKMESADIKTEDGIKQEEPSVDLFCPTTGKSRAPGEKPPMDIIESNSRPRPAKNSDAVGSIAQKCYLCGKMTEDFYATCAIMRGYRLPFLSQVMTRTADDWQRITALRKTPDVNAYFCVAHVAKGPVKFNPPNRKTQEVYVSGKAPLCCDFCTDPVAPVVKSPRHPNTKIKQFFDSLHGLTPKQHQDIQKLMLRPNKSLSVCSRHFKEKRSSSTPAQAVKPNRLLMSRLRRCDICFAPAAQFIMLKDGNQTAPQTQLFDNLVTFTEDQRQKIEYYKTNNVRANICIKHLASYQPAPQRTAAHILPFARIQERLKKKQLEDTKKPLNVYAAMEEEFAPFDMATESKEPKEIKEEPMEIKEEPLDEIIEVKPEPLDFNTDAVKEEPLVDLYDPASGTSRALDEPQESPSKPKCDLCTRPVAPFVTAPSEMDERKKFFDSMRRLTPVQSERAHYCSTHPNIQAVVCKKHIGPSLRAPILKSLK